MTAALPTLGKAAVGVGGSLLGGMLSKKLSKPPGLTPAGQRAQTGLFDNSARMGHEGGTLLNAGGAISREGDAEFRRGAPGLDMAQSYLAKIAGGDPAATAAAIAPQVGQISSIYRGANRSLDRSGISGANRQIAEADMARERAASIGGLVLNQRPGAINSLAQISQGRQQAGNQRSQLGLATRGLGLEGIARSSGPLSQIYSGELGRGAQQADQQKAFGGVFGDFLFDLLRSRGGAARLSGMPEMSAISRAGFGLG